MHDKRLIGTWKSDKRKTSKDMTARSDISAKARATLSRMFGKLETTYTRTRFYAKFEDLSESGRYKVVAMDESSVVTVSDAPYSQAMQHTFLRPAL